MIDTQAYPGYWTVPPNLPRQKGRKKLWLTSDEHYGHKNILRYQQRPFASVEEMNSGLIERHNSVVHEQDHVIHLGDFCFGKKEFFLDIAQQLQGTHYFMDGSHDRALRDYFEDPDTASAHGDKILLIPKLFEFTFGGRKIVLCHYAMRTWWASHYDSVHFFGHSHGKLQDPQTRSRDVGVDTTNYYPIDILAAIASVEQA
jgi:calcineurin-like phosphoesterase family protein